MTKVIRKGGWNGSDGFFWRKPDGRSFPELDYVEAVEIINLGRAEGADNEYSVRSSSVYLSCEPEKLKSALDTCGYELEGGFIIDGAGGKTPYYTDEGLALIVDAYWSYWGLDDGIQQYVRVGEKKEAVFGGDRWPEPDVILPADASIEEYVAKEFLA